jgi:hypothetical protein
MTRRVAAPVLLIATVLAGCISPAPSPTPPSPSASPPIASPVRSSPSAGLLASAVPSAPPSVQASIDPALAQGRLVQCGAGAPAFPAELLLRPGSAETGIDEPASLLRDTVLMPIEENDFPRTGWTRIDVPPRTVLFVAPSANGWKVVGVELGATGWTVDQYGSCGLRPTLPKGVNAASWWVDPAAAPLAAGATRVMALIHEQACASGRPPIGRVLDPEIVDQPDRVIVTFSVRDQPGGQDCQGNPTLAVAFELPTPIGNRPLFDGGEFPPRDATIPVP